MASLATFSNDETYNIMNALRKRRLYGILIFAIGLSLAAALILYALRQNMNLFFSPGELAAAHVPVGYHCRLGGMVKPHSVTRDAQNLMVRFTVTDFKKDIVVEYNGVLPDLFREGSGIVAEGVVRKQGVFTASQVLAKHDEKYMPKGDL